ncbi:FMN-dependent NADH-azoreductase 1 [Capsulimonas corticalis]|uniref:FMN dependent NADH:quinone oxidoreductase n=1 Tax=Capsulimonas corticalis TaxID=2219043 RepID=A0A402CS05_9BACT|nr:FMN-dependent NADH-azoreductase 1 [Capsulimonas corticalis]
MHVDSSPRVERSHTRRLSAEFVESWRDSHPETNIVYRDIGRNPIPHVTEEWIGAAFTPTNQRTSAQLDTLALSDRLVDELLEADVYVMGIPMYNFGVSSGFKAYIDQIVRIGRTFLFEPQDPGAIYKPLLTGKTLYVITASGDSGYEPGGVNARINHLAPYLHTVFQFIGVTDISVISVGSDEFGGERLQDSLARARKAIAEISAR